MIFNDRTRRRLFYDSSPQNRRNFRHFACNTTRWETNEIDLDIRCYIFYVASCFTSRRYPFVAVDLLVQDLI